MLGGDEAAHAVRIQARERIDLLGFHPAQQLVEIPPVAIHRMRRGLALAGEAGEPGLDLAARVHAQAPSRERCRAAVTVAAIIFRNTVPMPGWKRS